MDRWRALRRSQPNSLDPEPNTSFSPPRPPPLRLDNDFRVPTEKLQPQKSAPADLFPIINSHGNHLDLPSLDPESKRNYVNVASKPSLMKMLSKHGELEVLFADKVLKVGASGKMKRRVLLITNISFYLLDPDSYVLKRRVVIAAVNKLCLSNSVDHFIALIIQNEYDCLMVSTRKMEIVSAILEARRSQSEDEIDVSKTNSFTYRASSQSFKQVVFEEVEGGIKTKILNM